MFFTVGGAFFMNAAGVVASLGPDIRANGIMLSPDERTLYVTNGAGILAFDVARRRHHGGTARVREAGGRRHG